MFTTLNSKPRANGVCWIHHLAKIDVRSSLQPYFTVIHDKCVEYSVEAPTTAASFFILALHGLNTLGMKSELLIGVEWLHSSIP